MNNKVLLNFYTVCIQFKDAKYMGEIQFKASVRVQQVENLCKSNSLSDYYGRKVDITVAGYSS